MKINHNICALLCILATILIFAGCESKEKPVENPITEAQTESSSVIRDGKFLGLDIIEYNDYVNICAKNELQKTNFIDNLAFNNIPLPYASDGRTYYVTVERGSDWSGGVFTSDGEETVRFIHNEYDNLDIPLTEAVETGYNYKLVAYNDSDYIMVNVVFTYLPVMSVTDPDGDSDNPTPFGSEDSFAYMSLSTASSSQSSDAYIHSRGGSSRSFPKIGYKLSLTRDGEQRKLNLLGMRNDDDWILLPLYTEESKIRDKLSIDLWSEFAATRNDFGLHNGTQMNYIELIINGKYWGLYGLVVPVDKAQQKISVEDGEVLLKIESWEIPSSHSLRHAGDSEAMESITMKQPEPANQEAWNLAAEFVRLIYEASDEEFASEIVKYVDVENVMNYWIMVNIMSGQDNAWKNMFVTFKKQGDSYKILLCPWDCDLTWGVTWKEDAPLFWQYKFDELTTTIGAGDLPNRMLALNVGDAVNVLQSRWELLRMKYLSQEKLFNRVDELSETVRGCGAFAREVERWQDGGHAENNDYIKKFITARLSFLDKYIDNLG